MKRVEKDQTECSKVEHHGPDTNFLTITTNFLSFFLLFPQIFPSRIRMMNECGSGSTGLMCMWLYQYMYMFTVCYCFPILYRCTLHIFRNLQRLRVYMYRRRPPLESSCWLVPKHKQFLFSHNRRYHSHNMNFAKLALFSYFAV